MGFMISSISAYGSGVMTDSPEEGVFQQGKKAITGTVLDENGNPLAGATVLVKGSNAGSITDNEGRFAGLSVKETDYLEVSYLGYVQQDVAVKGKTSFTITLQPNRISDRDR